MTKTIVFDLLDHETDPVEFAAHLESGARLHVHERRIVQDVDMTPLMYACDRSHVNPAILSALLACGASVSDTTSDQMNAFMLACANPCATIEVLRLLLDAGAQQQIHDVADDGWTALMFACEHRKDPEIIRFLLDRGAKDSLRTETHEERWTAIMFASVYNTLEIVQLLWEYDPVLPDHDHFLEEIEDEAILAFWNDKFLE